MNKSLVLVMCDVLVLSAMSLSTGGFSDEYYGSGNDARRQVKLDGHKQELVELLREASNKWVSVSRDLTEKSNELARTTVALSGLSNEISVVAGKYDAATNDLSGARAQASGWRQNAQRMETLLGNLSNNFALVSRDLIEKSNALARTSIALSGLSNEISVVAGKYDQAIKERDLALIRLDNEFGQGYEQHCSRILACKYGLFVKERGSKPEMYYSPLISIGTNLYLMAYMPRKKVCSLGEMQALSVNCKVISAVDSVWGLRGEFDQNIAFFRLTNILQEPALSVGVSKEGVRDHFYWFRSRAFRVERAGILSADINSALDEYIGIKPGDMLISERWASVVKMATSKVSAIKSEVYFNKKITEGDLMAIK